MNDIHIERQREFVKGRTLQRGRNEYKIFEKNIRFQYITSSKGRIM